MKYCKKCVQPDTRPGVQFDKDGVCLACRFSEQNVRIDWDARKKELDEIVKFGRKNNVSGYDCIVGVSGGKDSTRQAFFVRDELGLKPLLVNCGYPPEQMAERGAHNISNLVSLGFDCICAYPDPQVWKKLMLIGFLRHGNWGRSTEMALYASAPKVAIAYHIPLIFLGENPAIALGNTDVGSTTGDANKMKYCHTLKGGPDELINKKDGITEQDLFLYRYPSDEEMEWAKLRVVYLGYYIKDFTRFKNAEFALNLGLQIRDELPEETGEIYKTEALDEDFVIINQALKYFKFGFGKATDQVAEAVRLGKITRKEAIELVKKYDGVCGDKFIERFCKYLGISKKEFWRVAESYRSKDIFEKDANGMFKIKIALE